MKMARRKRRNPNESNGQQLSQNSDQIQMCRPALVISIGSTANVQQRWGKKCVQEDYGEIPEHVAFFSIDAAEQARDDLAPQLQDEEFLNLSEDDSLIDCLKEASRIPSLRDRLPAEACNIAGGQGSGSLPQVADFFFEESLPRFEAKLNHIVDPFHPSNRAVTSQTANGQMLRYAMAVQSCGPIDVLFLVSLVGGTAGALLRCVRKTQCVLKRKGISANYSLFATLPAVGMPGVDAQVMLQNTYGRLQELADANALDSAFDFIFLLPEPTASTLDSHNQLVGKLLANMLSPVGVAFGAKAVDTRRVLTQSGPLKQPKWLSLVNAATLKPTASDPVEFARGCLGKALSGSSRNLSKPSPMQTHGLTEALVTGRPIGLVRPAVPDRVGKDSAEAYLDNESRRLTMKAKEQLRKTDDDLSHTISIVKSDIGNWLKEVFLENGPQFAHELAETTVHRINVIKACAYAEQGKARSNVVSTAEGPIQHRLEAIVAEVERGAKLKYLTDLVPRLEQLQQVVESASNDYSVVTEVFSAEAERCQGIRRSFPSLDPATFAVLGDAALETLVDSSIPRFVQHLRQNVLQALDRDATSDQLKAVVEADVTRAANEFGHLTRMDEALRAAGEESELVFDNFIAAAQPKCRQQPFWDRRAQSMCWGFVTARSTHPVAKALQRKTGRYVRCVPMTGEEISMVTADFGIEIGSLVVTEEAVSAYCASTSEFSPFPRSDYEPHTDLLSAPERRWYEVLALPLILHLRSGLIDRCDIDGFYYNGEDRVLLGTSWMEACQALSGTRKLPGLPPLHDLAQEAERALKKDRDPDDVLEDLQLLEAKLTEEINAKKQKEPFLHWRSVLRTMLKEYRERVNEARSHQRIWSSGTVSHVTE